MVPDGDVDDSDDDNDADDGTGDDDDDDDDEGGGVLPLRKAMFTMKRRHPPEPSGGSYHSENRSSDW